MKRRNPKIKWVSLLFIIVGLASTVLFAGTSTLAAIPKMPVVKVSQGSFSLPSSYQILADLGAIKSGACATIQVEVMNPGTLGSSSACYPSVPGVITNIVNVTANETDTNMTNNRASVDTRVFPARAVAADLAIAKSVSPSPVKVGKKLGYSISVTNKGPSTATGVVVTDRLPFGVTFGSAQPSRGSYSEAGGIITWQVGVMFKDGTAVLDIVVTPTVVGWAVNNASVRANETDCDTSNNAIAISTMVNPLHADISITKKASTDTIQPGESVIYTITVTNNGPDDVTGVVVRDDIDP